MKNGVKKWLFILIISLLMLFLLLIWRYIRCPSPTCINPLCFDVGRDLPSSAVNGEWLALITEQRMERVSYNLTDLKQLAMRNIAVRVKVLEEEYSALTQFTTDYYLYHVFSIYRAEILEVYKSSYSFDNYDASYTHPRIRFSQIKRIICNQREEWFDDSYFESVPFFRFPPARVPISIGDELVLFLSGMPPYLIDPINGVFLYDIELSIEGNRAFKNVNEHLDFIITEADLLQISEMYADEPLNN